MIDPQQNRGLRVLSYLAMAQHELGEAINEETTGSEFARLYAAQAAASAKTPGGPAAPLEQLTAKLEIMANDRYNAGDYADCLLLLLDAARRAGFGLALLTELGFERVVNPQVAPESAPAPAPAA
jgi:hypothetical protein